jgi:hypothetical protein
MLYFMFPILWVALAGAAYGDSASPLRVRLLFILVSGLVIVVPSAVLLIVRRRGGIGVNADGVTVRGALGWSRHVPWHEVVSFDVDSQEQPRYRYTGPATTQFVVVVCRHGPPLRTSACRFSTSGYGPGTALTTQVLGALESARQKAQRGASAGTA